MSDILRADVLIEERWVVIPLDGVPMEKINLPFFYQLGIELNRLAEFSVDPKSRGRILMTSFRAYKTIRLLFDEFPMLTVCRTAGEELIVAIDGIEEWFQKVSTEKFSEPDSSTEIKFRYVIDKAKKFETVLVAELDKLATYHITKKGIYSIPDLIDRTENMLPDTTRGKIGLNVVEEIRQSGRCLAFDNSTASGFHILRATELVMHEYYLAVCKPKPKPASRLESWGAYLAELKKSTDPNVQRVITLLQQIKDDDRNLIMHPERVLSPDEAFSLFEIAKSAIIVMGNKLPAIKKK